MWSWGGWCQDATLCVLRIVEWIAHETADPHKLAYRDVLVLAVSSIAELQRLKKLWLAFWTGQQFRYIAAHQIARQVGPKQDFLLFQHFMLWHLRSSRLRYTVIWPFEVHGMFCKSCQRWTLHWRYTLWVWNEYNGSQQIRELTYLLQPCCKTVGYLIVKTCIDTSFMVLPLLVFEILVKVWF